MIDENDFICHDKTSVLRRWQNDFKNLYDKAKSCEGNDFDETFYYEVLKYKETLENQDFTNEQNENISYDTCILNRDITLEEVVKAVREAKNGRACDEDNLPYEVF